MQKFEAGQQVQSLVDRGAPTLVVVDIRQLPNEILTPDNSAGNYHYLCNNGKWYIGAELGRIINSKLQH